ncbi:hypothetical protein RHO14_03300 [Orbus wheelerorum]|uniref:hypothetical protein n=1 Tax=Orbus wheelerorum TaxID=3074111 RepID=UPI00370D749B
MQNGLCTKKDSETGKTIVYVAKVRERLRTLNEVEYTQKGILPLIEKLPDIKEYYQGRLKLNPNFGNLFIYLLNQGEKTPPEILKILRTLGLLFDFGSGELKLTASGFDALTINPN